MTDREGRIDRAIAEYLDAAQRGEPVNREQWLSRHADLRPELESFLANKEAFDGRAEGLLTAALPADAEEPATAPPDATAQPTTVIRYFGDYELLSELARGGMGVVFRARQVSLNRPVAVKMILSGQLASPDDVRRFRSEAEAAANLDHPHILPIYEVGDQDGQHYFSMKLVGGGNLTGRVRALVRDPRAAAALLAKVARAVHFAHQRGILHRDLKPANILLDADDTPYVTDFGLAKRVGSDAGLTHSGAFVGTPSYTAPEKARADKLLTTAVDVYALGAVLYELITGRPPFRAETTFEREPDRPRALNPAADRDLETIALKCLAKEPAKRYESAAALAGDLERWSRGEPILARRIGVAERVWKWSKRRPALTSLAVLLVLTGVLGFAAVVWQWQETRKQLYHNRVVLAQKEVEVNSLVRAKVLLDECPPGLRGWEWRYVRRLCFATPHLTYPKQPSYVERVAWAPSGKYFATAARRADDKDARDRDTAKEVKVWHGATKSDVLTIGAARPVLDLAFSPDDTHLAIATGSEVAVWDLTTGQCVHSFDAQSEKVLCVAYSHDGKRLAAGQKRSVKVWDTTTLQEVLTIDLTSEPGLVCDLAFQPDNQYLALATKGKGAGGSIWNVRANQKISSFELERKPAIDEIHATSVVLSPDGTRGAWMSLNGDYVVLAGTNTGQEIVHLPVHSKDWRGGMAFSHDSQRFAVGVHPSGLAAASGALMFIGQISNTHILDDLIGKFIAVYDTTTGRRLLTLRGHEGFVEGLAFRPDGRRFFAVGGYSYFAPYDREGRSVSDARTEIGSRNSTIVTAAISQDGRRVAGACANGVVYVWDARSGRQLLKIQGRYATAASVAFSPDGTRIVSGNSDGTIKVWHSATGQEVLTLRSSGTSRSRSVQSRWSPNRCGEQGGDCLNLGRIARAGGNSFATYIGPP